MAISTKVWQPPAPEAPKQTIKESPWQKLAKVGQVVGAATTFVNPAIGAGITGLSAGLGAFGPQDELVTEKAKDSQQFGLKSDQQNAVERRVEYQELNPEQALIDATITLDKINLPTDTKRALMRPLLQAQQMRV